MRTHKSLMKFLLPLSPAAGAGAAVAEEGGALVGAGLRCHERDSWRGIHKEKFFPFKAQRNDGGMTSQEEGCFGR